jgi:hypothetical protein
LTVNPIAKTTAEKNLHPNIKLSRLFVIDAKSYPEQSGFMAITTKLLSIKAKV